MLLRLIVLLPLLAGSLHTAAAQQADTLHVIHVPFDVSLWRGISIGDAVAGPDTSRVVHNNFHLALPYGEAYSLDGIALGIAGTAYHSHVRGLQIGGIGNVAAGRMVGIQLAGLGNIGGERVQGIQSAGLANIAGEDLTGIQTSGLANIAGGRLHGIQTAGLANIAGEGGFGLQAAGLLNIVGEDFSGLQFSGLLGVSGGSFAGVQTAGLLSISGEGMGGLQVAGLLSVLGDRGTGLQVSGIGNVAGESMRGAQLAGLGNIAGELYGLQLAGLANIAGESRGLQLAPVNIAGFASGVQVGLVNIAGEQRGIPIGLFSRSGGVPVHMDVWADETAALLVSLRSGSERVTNYGGVGARPFAGSGARWDAHAGLGVAGHLTQGWTWGVEVFAHGLFAENFGGTPSGLFRLRVPFAYELPAGVSLFAGPTVNVLVTSREDADLHFPALDLAEGRTAVTGWIGAAAGVRIQVASGGTRLRAD